MEQFANNPQTTLSAAITSTSATSLTVTSASSFPASGNFRILIDSEIMEVTAVSTNTFTVTRGSESTTAATHSDNAPVYGIITAAALNSIISIQSATVDTSDRRILNFDANFSVADDSGTSACNIGLASIGSGEIMGNSTSGSAEPSGATLTSIIDKAIANTQGDILYRSSTAWAALAPGTSGQFLQTQGSSENPQWATVPGTVGYGAGASKPGTGASTGAIYIPSDGVIINVWNGSAWVGMNPDGAIYTLPPTVSGSNWTIVNSSQTELGDIPGGGVNLQVTDITTGSDYYIVGGYIALSTVSSASSTNYQVTACIDTLGAGNWSSATLGIIISDGTKFIAFGICNSAGQFNIQTTTTATTSASNVTNVAIGPIARNVWCRIVGSASHRTYYCSNDGINFIQVYQEAENHFLTETYVGFGAYITASSGSDLGFFNMNLLSWTIAT